MGYQITYKNGGIEKSFIKNNKLRKGKHWLNIIFIVLVLLASVLLCNSETRQFILPGNGAVTEAAIKNLISSVEKGTDLGDAITTFCQEIIHSAQ